MSRVVNLRVYTFNELPADIQEKAIEDYIRVEGVCPIPYEAYKLEVMKRLKAFEFFDTGDIYGEL